MRLPEIDQVAALIAETAREIILPRFGRLEAGAVMEKAPGDLVTIADQEGEVRLTERLPDLLPGSRVVGEEAYAKSPAVLDTLDGEDPVWVIDPVDGTANFVAGRPRFATIVALARKGETLAGWIHLPIEDRTAWAIRGEGAYLDGQRLILARPGPLSTLRGGFNLSKTPPGYGAALARLRDAVASRTPVNCRRRLHRRRRGPDRSPGLSQAVSLGPCGGSAAACRSRRLRRPARRHPLPPDAAAGADPGRAGRAELARRPGRHGRDRDRGLMGTAAALATKGRIFKEVCR